jgi:carboxypeptidase Taq
MTTATTSAYDQLTTRRREAATFGSVGSLLSWDQETKMPPKAAAFRAEQLSAISKLRHEKLTDPALGELISACESDDEVQRDEVKAANVREARRDFDRATKLPTELVVEMAETASRAMTAWKEARKKSDFGAFEPWLEKQVQLNRRKAECYGVPEGGELYDALLEDFEPGMRTAQVKALFGPLRERLTPLIAAVVEQGDVLNAAAGRTCPIPLQETFLAEIAGAIGYDLEGGRIDPTTHPFCESMGPRDTRITTRFDEENFLDALQTTLHEAGHAMYEQGLETEDHFGEPRAEAVSLGIHESQSRLWENQVGRSEAFWNWALPIARRVFKPALDDLTVEQAFRASNIVRPHFIRVESDEATYNLHIMLRFDIERLMLSGDLAVKDVPAWWNDRMKTDLGLDVKSDAQGCLQDVHWSMGAIGYFPTYTLGNLYCAQLWDKANEEMPNLMSDIENGEFAPLLTWLREKIHKPGRTYKAPELCERVTGKPLSHEPLCDYLEAKLSKIYSL